MIEKIKISVIKVNKSIAKLCRLCYNLPVVVFGRRDKNGQEN
jgi:hypothetical protein